MTIILAHQSLGEVDCCGCISAVERGDGTSDLVCNECGERIRAAVPTGEVEHQLAQLAETCGCSVLSCPRCGALSIASEVASVEAAVCPHCDIGMVRRLANPHKRCTPLKQ